MILSNKGIYIDYEEDSEREYDVNIRTTRGFLGM